MHIRPNAKSPAGKTPIARPPPRKKEDRHDHHDAARDPVRDAYVGARVGGRKLEVKMNLGGEAQGSRVRVMDMSRGRVKAATGKPAGVDLLRLDGPHKGAEFPHLNVANMPPALKRAAEDAPRGLNHLRVPHVPDGVLRAARHGGRALLVAGVALDAADLVQSHRADQLRGDGQRTELKKAVGRVAGGWAGAAGGAAVGAAIGSVIPGLGTAIGGLVGGLVGGFGGSWAGSAAGEEIATHL